MLSNGKSSENPAKQNANERVVWKVIEKLKAETRNIETRAADYSDKKQAALEASKQWEQVLITEDFQALPKGEPDAYVRVYVYRVL